ncbi:MAG: sensor histidine kinase, partial [Aestuariivirgaceae bacterium]
ILDFSKTQSGKMKLDETEFDIDEVVEGAVRTFSQAVKDKAIELHVDGGRGLPALSGDLRKITQILLNLLSNAIKFTDEGGRIDVALECDDNGLAISVADTGSGLTLQELDLVMKPFEQANNAEGATNRGTGLGLPLSRDFAEMHGGTLKIDSVKNEGTTVTVWLPASRFVGKRAAV